MTESEFIEFARSAAQRAASNIGQIGHLVCTQARNPKEPTVREPEMRTAFQWEAEERGLLYGIEVPTHYTYRFAKAEGLNRRKALVDFALLGSASATADRDVLVEFKQGQPNGVHSVEDGSFDYPKITKDLHKLWAEPGRHGRCMFHICQAADAGTLTAIEAKYNAVTQHAINLASDTVIRHSGPVQNGDGPDRWFLLLILVLRQRCEKTGSYLHRATWDGSKWVFSDPELLSPAATVSVQP